MKIVYSSTSGFGRELRVEADTSPGSWQVKVVCDAPGERAVSHDLTQEELEGLIASLTALLPKESGGGIVLPTGVEEPNDAV